MGRMKSDFVLAITQLAAEKNLPQEVVLEAVETALASAFRKNSFAAHQNVSVKINPSTGKITFLAEKEVAETVSNPLVEVSLEEARAIRPDVETGDIVAVEATPKDSGRIVAQTAKQVVLQRLREAEREIVFEEYSDREADIVTGIVQRIEPRHIVVDLGRTEAILPNSEQVHTEHYRVRQRLKAYLMEVHRTSKGPQLVISRTHKNLLRRLLELEVPEIHSGVVELKAIAREPGYRSKVAVAARQPGVDAVGCCVGLRGIRIQNLVNELNGEKIDIVEWNADPKIFIASALSPAQVTSVAIDEEEKTATVVVPDRLLSLAIGKEGQNARLAAKLTGWRIDIKSASVAEAEKAVVEEEVPIQELLAEAPAEEAIEETIVEEVSVEQPVAAFPALEAELEEPLPMELAEPVVEDQPAEEYAESLGREVELAPIEEVAISEEEAVAEATPVPQLRFAEDIFTPRVAKPDKKGKKAKAKGTTEKEAAAKPKKTRRTQLLPGEIQDYEELLD